MITARFVGGPSDGKTYQVEEALDILVFDHATFKEAFAATGKNPPPRTGPYLYGLREIDEDGVAIYDYDRARDRRRMQRRPPTNPPTGD